MIVEGKKIVKLEELEKQKLREALEVIKELSEEINYDEIKYVIEDLENLIYTDEWECEF